MNGTTILTEAIDAYRRCSTYLGTETIHRSFTKSGGALRQRDVIDVLKTRFVRPSLLRVDRETTDNGIIIIRESLLWDGGMARRWSELDNKYEEVSIDFATSSWLAPRLLCGISEPMYECAKLISVVDEVFVDSHVCFVLHVEPFFGPTSVVWIDRGVFLIRKVLTRYRVGTGAAGVGVEQAVCHTVTTVSDIRLNENIDLSEFERSAVDP